MTPVTQIRGFMPFTAIVLLQAAVALGHSTVIYTAISRGYTGQHPLVLTALANALVILPMVLMFSPAGYFTDRLPKSLVMRWASLAGLIASVLIVGSYYLGWFWGAFALTLLLSVQNVFYFPSINGLFRQSPRQSAGSLVRHTKVCLRAIPCFP